MQPRASGTAGRRVVGLFFIQVRLRSAPGPLVGFPERGHPFGLATDGEPAQDEVEGGRAHGLGWSSPRTRRRRARVLVKAPGLPGMLRGPHAAHGEVVGGGQGVGGVLRQGRGGGRLGCLRLAAPGLCCHHEPSPHCRPGGACVQKRQDVSTCTWTSRITCARSILAPAVSRPRTPGCCHLTNPLLRRLHATFVAPADG